MKRMREILQKDADDLAWTMVNPPGLTNGALTDKIMEYEVGDRMESRKDKGAIIFNLHKNWSVVFRSSASEQSRCGEFYAQKS